MSTAPAPESKAVKLRILEKEVQIACKPGEENDLARAAAHVDKTMRELRQRSPTTSSEKIAIVTAINTANTLMKLRSGQAADKALASQLAGMNQKLEALLSEED